MSTTSLIALVEALYLDLKTHGIKKNAIEAKIREICVKGQRHIWSLKADTEVNIFFVIMTTADVDRYTSSLIAWKWLHHINNKMQEYRSVYIIHWLV